MMTETQRSWTLLTDVLDAETVFFAGDFDPWPTTATLAKQCDTGAWESNGALIEARQIWRRNLRDDDQFEREQQQLARAFADPALDGSVREYGQMWWQRTRPLYAHSRRWFNLERQMKTLYVALMQEPWDNAMLGKAEGYLCALEEAEDKWRCWAFNDALSWEDTESLIDDPAISTAAQKVLKRWHAAMIERGTRPWHLRLVWGVAPEDYGVARQPGVRSKDGWVYGNAHWWSHDTGHRYDPESYFSVIKFEWQPGDGKIGILMCGERRWLVKGGCRRILIPTQDFAGPLAIWRLHDAGRVSHGGFILEFELVDCPGPPPRRRQAGGADDPIDFDKQLLVADAGMQDAAVELHKQRRSPMKSGPALGHNGCGGNHGRLSFHNSPSSALTVPQPLHAPSQNGKTSFDRRL